MRLPERVKTGVQPLALRNVYAEVGSAVESARMLSTAGDVLMGIHQINEEARQKRTQDQMRDASLLMQQRMLQFEEQYGGRDFLTPDEIPDSVQVKRTSKQVGEDGLTFEAPREQIPAYEVMPDMFRRFGTSMVEAAGDLIEDEDARTRWMQDMELRVGEQFVDRLARSREQQTKYVRNKIVESVEEALDARRYATASELAADMDDPDMARQLNIAISRRIADDRFNDLIVDENANPDTIIDAIQVLRDPDSDLPYNAQERLAKANALESNYKRVTAHEQAVAERNRQKLVSDTWLLIDDGNPQVDEAYVDQLFDAQHINGDTRTSMIRAILKGREQGIRKQAIQIDLDRVAAAGYGIDPKDTELRAAVGERFEQYVEQNGGDVWGAATRAMQEFKVVPDQIMSMFRSANRADAPNVANAARLLMEAQDYAPSSLADFKSGEISFLENVVANMRLGLDTQAAISAAQSYTQMTPQQKAALDRESKLIFEDNAAALSKMIGKHPAYDIPWSIFDPKPNAFMVEEFNALTKRFLPDVGFNTQVAQQKAFTKLSQKWQLTKINGDWELAKNMPQAPVEDVRSDIASQMQGRLKQFSEFHGRQFKYNDVKIYADPLTQIQINDGQKPTYAAYLIVDADNGVIEHLPRFTWDAQAAAERRRRKALEDATRRREVRRESVERLTSREIRI
jgi:hypothetical protein